MAASAEASTADLIHAAKVEEEDDDEPTGFNPNYLFVLATCLLLSLVASMICFATLLPKEPWEEEST